MMIANLDPKMPELFLFSLIDPTEYVEKRQQARFLYCHLAPQREFSNKDFCEQNNPTEVLFDGVTCMMEWSLRWSGVSLFLVLSLIG